MAYIRYIVVSLCVVLVLVSCVGSDTSKLQLTIDAQNTRLATMESATQEPGAVPTSVGTPTATIPPAGLNTAVPEVGQTEATESAKAAGLTGMLLPGETWQKGETEITLSNPTFTPGCGGLFGFQLEIADYSGGILNSEDIAIYDESDRLYSDIWWKSGLPSGQCYDSRLDALSWNSAGRPTVIISFRVLGDPDRGVSRVEVTAPDPSLGTAVWDIHAFENQQAQIAETAGTPEPIATPTPEVPPERIPTLLWSVETESYAIRDDSAFILMPDGSIEARELKTGRILWQNENGGMIIGADSRHIYVAPTDRRIDALDLTSGEFKWRTLVRTSFETDSSATRLVDTGNTERVRFFLYIKYEPNHILDVNPSNGDIITVIPRNGVPLTGDIIYDDFRGTTLHSGRSLWEIPNIRIFSICDSDRLIYTTYDDLVVAFNTETGENIWSLPLRTSSSDSIACGNTRRLPDTLRKHDIAYANSGFYRANLGLSIWQVDSKSLYFIPGESAQFISLDMESGEVLWSFYRTEGGDDNTETLNFLGEYDSKLFYSQRGYGLTRAYASANHELLWENAHLVVYSLVGVRNNMLIGLTADPGSRFQSILVGLDSETGNERWRVELGEWEMRDLVDEYFVYKLEDGSALFFLDPDTGDTVASIPTPGDTFRFSGGIVKLDDLFVAGSYDALLVITP